MSQRYSITNDVLFKLNPSLAHDCTNVQPETEYCVKGFVEPLRAFDGKCGPPNNNATCVGTDNQCCNSQTWTCGSSTEDCAPGTCYEGVCDGDLIYSTDGTCG
ncbi:carbohydrate-binding module family 18 protein [Parathielavia hyrcaniae]|uniref:Carbohydrate-binding module family 18 protein n=1 Tax=Parathielavia hyrcaniae TaxID=113614 RepID=A0AAN6QCG8_9PEZI|nr:carbohydrate-binding module family 18 protein [Parathielavia hyrcaniae]